MATVIIAWGEEGRPAKPLVTVPGEDVAAAVLRAKTWCQHDVTLTSGPELEWQHYLSRGSGPGTAHHVAKWRDETFEIWIVGELD